MMQITQKNDPEIIKRIIEDLKKDNEDKGHPKNGQELAYIAEDGREYLGGIFFSSMWDWVLIDKIYVHKKNKGVGSKLLEKVEAWAQENDKKGLFLDTGAWQATSFYEQHGYKEFGRIPEYSKGEDSIFYLKVLK